MMDIDSILESKNREGERTSSTGQAFRMDSVPDVGWKSVGGVVWL